MTVKLIALLALILCGIPSYQCMTCGAGDGQMLETVAIERSLLFAAVDVIATAAALS